MSAPKGNAPPADEHELEYEDDLPPLDDEDPAEEEGPEMADPDVDEVKAALVIPVKEELITGNELKRYDEKKAIVKVELESDVKAPQMAPQMKDKNRDAAYEKKDRGGDETYEREGHGKVLVVETAKDTDSAMLHNSYYQQGYTGAQGSTMGNEAVKNYNYQRKVRERQQVHTVPEKGAEPAKPKRRLPEKEKKKKEKKVKGAMVFGTDEYPLRLARKDGRFKSLLFAMDYVLTCLEREPVKLTCVNCKSQITSVLKKEMNMAKVVSWRGAWLRE